MKQVCFTIILLIASLVSYCQVSPKQLPAIRTMEKIVVDGDINDVAWKNAPVATDFIEHQPSFGNPEESANRTEVKFLYDDNAIYVSGFCHESNKDSLSTELVGRDVVGSNDFVGIMFDTYADKINGFGYFVTPLGEQFDAKYSSMGEDPSWNSVYFSSSKIVDGGWTFEVRIPYAAIRFGSKPTQSWGLNIIRQRRRSGRKYFWNPVNPTINGLFNQAGTWSNIQNIKPPIRLSFSPYLSTYFNHYPYNSADKKNWNSTINGGMDVKYGINQSFTLDMTLIPDFGQVQSDNQVLNLTPFEVKYNEYRTFFTEGTDLFSKGNLFYSRRIGGTPMHYWSVEGQLTGSEKIKKNPGETKLINATKISGRTSTGLGIGILNAVAASTYAVVEDDNKMERKIETNPLTNYNIVVLDQALKHNSSISLINTNVLRSGSDYDANVTAGLFDIYDKDVNYNVWGRVGVSQLMGYTIDKRNINGYNHNLNFGKMKGLFTWSVSQNLADNKYDQRDMGYFTNNNYFNHQSWIGYKLLKEKSFYKNMYFNLNFGYNQRYVPRSAQNFWLNSNVNGLLKNLWNFSLEFNYSSKENDFYEPRLSGMVFKRPYNY